MLLAQLVNLAVNPASPTGKTVEHARHMVQGAIEQASARAQYLEQKAQELPGVAHLVHLLK